MTLPGMNDPWMFDRERAAREKLAGRVRDTLAASSVSDIATLRLALAEIEAHDRDFKNYRSRCHCSTSGRGCAGHVTNATKTARRALGLPELPDRPLVTTPAPEPKPAKKRKKGKGKP